MHPPTPEPPESRSVPAISRQDLCLGIDASGIVTGGGLVHLREMLRASPFVAARFQRIVCWAAPEVVGKLPSLPHVTFLPEPNLGRGFLARARWQRFTLPRLVRTERCDILFVAGSSSVYPGREFSTINHNLLPFEWRELLREGLTRQTARLITLRWLQGSTMRRARGTIFLSQYAEDVVRREAGPLRTVARIVPHGVNEEFRCPPRPARSISACSPEKPFRLLYVSPVAMYKHQWNVISAFGELRRAGMPISLDFVGTKGALAGRRYDAALRRLAPGDASMVSLRAFMAHGSLPRLLQEADLFVFASSCETFGISLVEAMAAGLPVACARRGPMPSILGESGYYFDPLSPTSISQALREAIDDVDGRERRAREGYERAQAYSWSRCARETFEFLRAVHLGSAGGSAK
jgi:glycosyltransferase involved in cell wall biosynthesis